MVAHALLLCKNCVLMMYRIVYTKLNYSLLSQCGINWINYTTYTWTISRYTLLNCLPLAVPQVNCLAEYEYYISSMYTPSILSSFTNNKVNRQMHCNIIATGPNDIHYTDQSLKILILLDTTNP